MSTPLSYAHLFLCLLLAGLLVWQALRYPGWRRIARVAAGLVAAAALWFSAFPPQRTVTVAAPDAAIVLTAHYQPDSLQKLLRALGPVPVLRYRTGSPATDTASLSSLAALPDAYPRVRQLHVLGLGLPSADLATLPASVKLVPHAYTATGFKAGNWPTKLVLGTPLRVEGSFGHLGNGPVWVSLEAAGAVRDSVQLKSGSGAFVLSYTPRRTGRLLARLSARQGSKTLAAEPVPTQVETARPLRVLLLAGSPSFEFNLLKTRLGEQGHQVALRVSVGRGLQQTDFINHAQVNLGQLSSLLLASHDVLVTDADALNTLSGTEARALGAAASNGLGVVLLAPADLPRSLPGRAQFALQNRPAAVADRPQQLHWPMGSGQTLLPALLRTSARLQPLVTAARPTEIVAAAQRVGWGTVVVSTATNTYRWQLAGTAATYDGYWSRLLTAAARPTDPVAEWKAAAWPQPHQPVELRLTSYSATRPSRARVLDAQGKAVQLALGQHPSRPNVWMGSYWPSSTGWHTVEAPGQASSAFFVYSSHDWLAPQATECQAAAQQWGGSRAPSSLPQQRREPWPAGWFFALFLVAAGFLWLDEKR
ncbi:hypothetical protein [Solirubrum puertoriconensis]|uniref:Uncharacterized protein n=1 Tax=Solirubrum puertoriconensis TaxID=1751427 RepID=A0A9X0HHR5_SOLP1|nr:hypothetical protein [Solirubrum puertoriconensis]KUG06119.1 hypothetical protein ASU33_01765 [Solirubrum puertoriconensis]